MELKGLLCVLPKRTFVLEVFHSLPGKVVIPTDWLAADVAHQSTTVAAGNLVASVLENVKCFKPQIHEMGKQTGL